ncbi:MAG: 23S rRNA (uracil(1939)-C(5))-methyltransferase RlmD [Eubacteriales bacterium]|nr:23S rRNA (uracil(1939)-C(5))-methyltransferase RlmD [Eubacteriales bacterium]
MKKDDILQLTIEDISSEGIGIGRADGTVLFVKDTITGDTVEAKIMKMKKTYGYARLMRIITPSPWRVQPVCPVARKCGGCQIQEMDYQAQLRFKEQKVRSNLERIGKFTEIPMEPIIGMDQPLYYRNKAQFPIGTDKNGHVIAGFYAGRTHTIIENRKCYLGTAVNEQVLNEVIAYMEEEHIPAYDEESGSGIVRHVLIRCGFRTKEVMVCLIANRSSLPKEDKLVRRLQKIPGMTSISLNINRERTNVILGKELRLLWGRPYIEDYIGSVKYQVSPLSFFQVNPVQTEKLYDLALEYAGLTGSETVWDLYCGIGTISLYLAQKAKKVYGVEIVPQAIDDACRNAKINNITNAQFYVGKAEEILPEIYRRHHIRANVIVVDPPRKGCDNKLLDTIIQMQPEKVVYVSCDSATLARDLRILCDHGYELKRCRAVDQFPMSVHVETCVLLVREKVNRPVA